MKTEPYCWCDRCLGKYNRCKDCLIEQPPMFSEIPDGYCHICGTKTLVAFTDGNSTSFDCTNPLHNLRASLDTEYRRMIRDAKIAIENGMSRE